MVIVGTGLAGVHAGMALREHGWEGAITLIGAESTEPYDRPPLSKTFLSPDGAAVPLVPSESFAAADIDILRGHAVTRIDRTAAHVEIENRPPVPYDRLLLATGAAARQLPMARECDVRYLRTLADAEGIRRRLTAGVRLVVIGAGFLGLELAASAVSLGCHVTVVEVAERILSRLVPADIADVIAKEHLMHKVDLRCGRGISSIASDEILLASGEIISADIIIVAIGAVPHTDLAETAGLVVSNGIVVNGLLQTSDPRIFAAGDCCSFPHPVFESRMLRLESWRNALDQGIHAARTMLGEATPFARVPWFWSDQFELGLQMAGLADEGCSSVQRRLENGALLRFDLAADGRLVAASGIGPGSSVAKDIRIAERLIERGATPDPAVLADAAAGLKRLLN